MKIIVGTNNQKKLDVVGAICSDLLRVSVEVTGYSSNSQVPEAPHDEETYRGALNRALDCEQSGEADAYIGIESGLVERYGNFFEEAWSVVSRNNKQYIGYSSGLLLPEVVTTRMAEGMLHNKIMEQIDKELKLPDDNRDTWSRYSGGQILRSISLEESLRNALIQSVPAKNSLYFIS
jgi:non-canonical (house-cleaning) NTP pyrophosphatase